MKDQARKILNIFFVFCILIFPIFVWAHPGGRDANGCHVCRTNCEKYNVPQDVRHCHLQVGTTTQTVISPAPPPAPKVEVKKSPSKVIEKKAVATSTNNIPKIDNLNQVAQTRNTKFFTNSSLVWLLSAAGIGLLAGLGFILSTKKP